MEEVIKKVVEKAVEGGYPTKLLPWCQECAEDFHRLLNDPNFWSSLGKSLGWAEREEDINQYQFSSKGLRTWKYHWHLFIDHLAEGKSPEDFFKNLIK